MTKQSIGKGRRGTRTKRKEGSYKGERALVRTKNQEGEKKGRGINCSFKGQSECLLNYKRKEGSLVVLRVRTYVC